MFVWLWTLLVLVYVFVFLGNFNRYTGQKKQTFNALVKKKSSPAAISGISFNISLSENPVFCFHEYSSGIIFSYGHLSFEIRSL